ncbi:hypothetical protein [Paenibacillus sp. YIM B09110]|uniref:hypothetical protein n=1 Tax=Paenibacillus sp. YIM B09110 TaxID=3126102 RepID=UPI00301D6B9D
MTVENVVDPQTGEIIDVIHTQGFRNGTEETQRVLIDVKPGEQVRASRPKKFVKHAEFTMVFHASNRELVREKQITDDEKALLFSVLIYLDYDQYVKDEENFYFNVKRVAELMAWDRNRTARVLESLRKKRLVGNTTIGRAKYYMLNPRFIYRGDTSGLTAAVRLFDQAAEDDGLEA